MGESGKDIRIADNEPPTILSRVKPERVAYITNPAIIEEKHLPYIREVNKRIEEENSISRKTGGQLYDLALWLGGDSPTNNEQCRGNSVQSNLEKLDLQFRYPNTFKNQSINGFSSPVNTGIDIDYLIENYPNDRWKFYLSMENRKPGQNAKINSFLTELIKKCTEKKVALLLKTSDHAYDNPDLYTWQPVTMANILKELYQDPRFSGIWASADHPFQRPLPGISKDHIGLVQEPICGLNGESHSGRMIALGYAITKLLPQYHNKFGYHVFVQACNLVGVMSTEPWRISQAALSTNNQKE